MVRQAQAVDGRRENSRAWLLVEQNHRPKVLGSPILEQFLGGTGPTAGSGYAAEEGGGK